MQKVVVITGASSGLGLASALMFQKAGYKTINISRRSVADLKSNYSCDVSNEEQVKEVFKKIGEKYKHIDILINNAGYGLSGATELIPTEEITRIYSVNVFGLLHCIRASLPYMKKNSKIINIGSAMALFPIPYRTLYASSKSAVNTLSYALRMECKPLGIQVSTICPGDIKTNFTKNRIKDFNTNERYGDRIKNSTESIDSRENKRMEPQKVAKIIFNKTTKKKIKPMIIIGCKYKLLYFITKITPISWLLNITEKFLGGHKKKKVD